MAVNLQDRQTHLNVIHKGCIKTDSSPTIIEEVSRQSGVARSGTLLGSLWIERQRGRDESFRYFTVHLLRISASSSASTTPIERT